MREFERYEVSVLVDGIHRTILYWMEWVDGDYISASSDYVLGDDGRFYITFNDILLDF